MRRAHRKDKPQPISRVMTNTQLALMYVTIGLVAVALLVFAHVALLVIVGVSLAFSMIMILMQIVAQAASKRHRFLARVPANVNDDSLPRVAIMIAMRHEAPLLQTLTDRLQRLRYPADKLDIKYVLDHDDHETQAEAIAIDLPSNFEVVVVPEIRINDVEVKGKPKCLNWTFTNKLSPDTALVGVYDAEDQPDEDQLLMMVATLRAAPDDVAGFQATLQFENKDNVSWISRMMKEEYSRHFTRLMRGYSVLKGILPLGGTSNFFKMDALRAVARSRTPNPVNPDVDGPWKWDNVTEDAELAAALAKQGREIVMFASHTLEEAPTLRDVAHKQRKRWLKGYLQTGMGMLQSPFSTIRRVGFFRWFFYSATMIGTPISLMLNPITWGLTIAYVVMRLTSFDGGVSFVESMYPPLFFYVGLALMVGGNAFLFFAILGAAIRSESYSSFKFLPLVFVWWFLMSVAAYGMLIELLRPSTRFAWNKTDHVKHAVTKKSKERKNALSTDNVLI
jgi:cellulose synthase/poly-beta-1,6-N-acetylglucosamine synthase-like glycosyltransferase